MISDFIQALDRAAQTGIEIPFWLRDDDATVPSPALDRLLSFDIPVTLAVIPRDTGAGLASHLHGSAANVAVHGWAHENHAGLHAKKCELGPERPAALVLAELMQGRDKIGSLFAERVVDMLVPPWNRIASEIVAELPRLGFRALSTFGPERAGPIPMHNTHVDPIDWHGTRSLRADPWCAATDRVVEITRTGNGAVGLLTHHLQHDDAIWRFTDEFVAVTRNHAACRWISSTQLLAWS